MPSAISPDNSAAQLRLSRAEILAFLVLVERRTLPGLPNDFADLSNGRQELVELLNEGFRSLSDRGLLNVTSEEAPVTDIHASLLVTLGQVLVSRHCVAVLHLSPPSGSRAHFFCVGPLNVVAYAKASPHEFLFEAMSSHEDGRRRLEAAVEQVWPADTSGWPDNHDDDEVFGALRLSPSGAVEFVTQAWDYPDKVRQHLVTQGARPAAAKRLVDAFRRGPSLLVVSAPLVPRERSTFRGRALLCVPDAGGGWGFETTHAPPGVRVTFGSREEWLGRIRRLWPPSSRGGEHGTGVEH